MIDKIRHEAYVKAVQLAAWAYPKLVWSFHCSGRKCACKMGLKAFNAGHKAFDVFNDCKDGRLADPAIELIAWGTGSILYELDEEERALYTKKIEDLFEITVPN